MSRLKVYIAGPISTIKGTNREAFYAAEDHLRSLGHEPLNPIDIDLGLDATWVDYMRATTRLLSTADAVYLLPGWKYSKGVTIELNWAMSVGLIVKPHNEWGRSPIDFGSDS